MTPGDTQADINPVALSSSATSFQEGSNDRRERLVRIYSWTFLAIAGLIQAWFSRHYAFSDGISYLEIATNYAKGDWHSALNSYWSPLYSWIIAAILVVFKTDPYWQPALLHLVNYLAYLASLLALEALLTNLFQFQRRHIGPKGFSQSAIRLAGYSVFLVASLLLIGMGYNSPDTVAMAIGFFLLNCLLRIEAGTARTATYILFGVALSLEYLCRAAFALFVPLYILIAAILLWNRKAFSLKPIAYTVMAALVAAAPFVIALSISKGRFTIGDAGKLNYGWEVDGAARSINWQGEPFDIGTPLHTTHRELSQPATFTFADSPVPGAYPLWYEPAYWYQGIQPRFKFGPQVKVLVKSWEGVLYLLLRSPITIPVLILAYFMGWRKWLSDHGILAYWFLLLPTFVYIFGYTLVYLDARYIAGSMVVIWICLLSSVTVAGDRFRYYANRVIQIAAVVFALVFVSFKLAIPTQALADDLVHQREKFPNLNSVIAEHLRESGFRPGDRIAMMGISIDAEWARIDGLKIVGEVPVTWERDNQLFRRVFADRTELKSFWWAKPQVKQQVYEAFRKAGAKAMFADYVPKGADGAAEWQPVVPVKAQIPKNVEVGQTNFESLSFRRLDVTARDQAELPKKK